MSNYATPELDHPGYHKAVHLRGYNGQVTVTSAVTDRDGAKVLRRVRPELSRADHKALAERHLAESERLEKLHGELLVQAHQATFGCPPRFEDYCVTAIGREEYPEDMKGKLRQAAYGGTFHGKVGRAHQVAATSGPTDSLTSEQAARCDQEMTRLRLLDLAEREVFIQGFKDGLANVHRPTERTRAYSNLLRAYNQGRSAATKSAGSVKA